MERFRIMQETGLKIKWFASYFALSTVATMYSERVPMRYFPPQIPSPELT